MTAPPGGPYGQDPQGPDSPWRHAGQQPPVDPYAETQYYPTNPPYPPYPPYPPPGGQYPPGGYPPPYPPGGPYPGYPPGSPYSTGPTGPPPRKSRTPWVIAAVAAVLVIAILAVAAVFALRDDDTTSTATPSLTTSSPVSLPPLTPSTATDSPSPSTSPSTSASASGEQTATECTANVSGGTLTGSTAQAGALGFPLSAAPGWAPAADTGVPNGIDVIGVIREVEGAKDWMMEAMVGVTNFVPSMSPADQASKLLTCVVDGPGYKDVSPTMGPVKKSSIKVGGVEAERVDVEVTIADASRGVPGDNVVVIAVKTDPVTFFLSTTPIGDADSQAQVEKIIDALKVTGR